MLNLLESDMLITQYHQCDAFITDGEVVNRHQ